MPFSASIAVHAYQVSYQMYILSAKFLIHNIGNDQYQVYILTAKFLIHNISNYQ